MPYAPGTTTGFNSLSDYMDANKGTLDSERSALTSDVGGQLDAAKSADEAVINATPALPAPAAPPPPEKNPFRGRLAAPARGSRLGQVASSVGCRAPGQTLTLGKHRIR